MPHTGCRGQKLFSDNITSYLKRNEFCWEWHKCNDWPAFSSNYDLTSVFKFTFSFWLRSLCFYYLYSRPLLVQFILWCIIHFNKGNMWADLIDGLVFLSAKIFNSCVAQNNELLLCGKPCSIFISCSVGLRGSPLVTKSIRVETHWHNNQKMSCSALKYKHRSHSLRYATIHRDRTSLSFWMRGGLKSQCLSLPLSLRLVYVIALKPLTWEARVRPLGNRN